MFSAHDTELLRGLARRVDEIARLPVMERRRSDWFAHNDLRLKRPLSVVFPEGSWRELLPALPDIPRQRTACRVTAGRRRARPMTDDGP